MQDQLLNMTAMSHLFPRLYLINVSWTVMVDARNIPDDIYFTLTYSTVHRIR